MLEPQDRHMLLEALRPPDGFHLHRAIGTTYTLDLLALLTTPLAFTFFDWSSEAGPLGLDPLLVLAAIRRNTERITIFCQAGRIQIPKRDQKLMPDRPFTQRYGFFDSSAKMMPSDTAFSA
jgi:hypothetical protein